MSTYVLNYDIVKRESIRRNLSPSEIKGIRKVRIGVKNALREYLSPTVITTYIIENYNSAQAYKLSNALTTVYTEIIKEVDIQLINIFEIKILLIELATNSKICLPSGEIKTVV